MNKTAKVSLTFNIYCKFQVLKLWLHDAKYTKNCQNDSRVKIFSEQ